MVAGRVTPEMIVPPVPGDASVPGVNPVGPYSRYMVPVQAGQVPFMVADEWLVDVLLNNGAAQTPGHSILK
jgi:hypothetical protein